MPNKPLIQLRQPPVDHVQAFLHADNSALRTVKNSNGRNSKRQRRQVTLYLEPDLAKRLKLHAVLSEQEMSDVAAKALQGYLDNTQKDSPKRRQ